MHLITSSKESRAPEPSDGPGRVEKGWALLPTLQALDPSNAARLCVAATLRACVDALPCLRFHDRDGTLVTRRTQGEIVAIGRYPESGESTYTIYCKDEIVLRHIDGEGYTTLRIGPWCEELRNLWTARMAERAA